MAGTRELRRRLTSVKNTKKITYAMKLVSAAKLRKAQEQAQSGRSFAELVYKAFGKAVYAYKGKDEHPLLKAKTDSNAPVRLIVVGGNRGLCGAYNTNVNKTTEQFIKKQENKGVSLEIITLGKKPSEYMRRTSRTVLAAFETLPEEPAKWPLEDICRSCVADFISGKISAVYVLYTKFNSALSLIPKTDQVLPLDIEKINSISSKANVSTDTIIEPNAVRVLEEIVPLAIGAQVRQGCFESKASENASRMTSMDAATKNAGDLIKKLSLKYNKLRQGNITSELLDIIGGAEATN